MCTPKLMKAYHVQQVIFLKFCITNSFGNQHVMES